MKATLSQCTVAMLLSSFACGVEPADLKLPKGYIVVPSSISPNRQYGVTAFDDIVNPSPDNTDKNKIIDLHTGRVIGEIHASAAMIHMSHGGILPARWSQDGSLLLWEVDGKWSPDALVLLLRIRFSLPAHSLLNERLTLILLV